MQEIRQRQKPSGSNTSDKTHESTQSAKKSSWALSFKVAFLVLVLSRLVSAFLNPVHDCDEVYNYWEPLHFLMFGSGMQTWEYSAEFALRSYLYPILHAPVGFLAATFAGNQAGKRFVFYAIKAFLGITSARLEAKLYSLVARQTGGVCGSLFLFFLATSTGIFISATSLLPSSFAMYMLTGAASGVLNRQPAKVIIFAVVCVAWGWPVAGVSLLPYALWVLLQGRFQRSIGVLFASLVAAILPVVAADRYFYGTWTVSLWNFLKYNVVGGGDSALYGVESGTYYFRNGLLNLNILLPLGLVAPLVALLRPGSRQERGKRTQLFWTLLPVWSWMAAISLLPHKEERFLYVVYPLICMGAAVSLHTALHWLRVASGHWLGKRTAARLSHAALALTLSLFALLSLSRSTALVKYYGAPMHIYSYLPEVVAPVSEEIPVCVGAEWHRFPSSFFLPDPAYRLRFVKSGFTGLLPRPYDINEGGTAAAGPYFNDRNKEEPANSWPDDSKCAYLVELDGESQAKKGESHWGPVQSLPFVIATETSSLLARTLYIPWYSSRHTAKAMYSLYSRKLPGDSTLLNTLSMPRSGHGRPF